MDNDHQSRTHITMTMKELVPANQNIILNITQNNEEIRTASGIIIPDTAKKNHNEQR
jgi:hypothetical protein